MTHDTRKGGLGGDVERVRRRAYPSDRLTLKVVRERYYIKGEPRDDEYVQLLTAALGPCDQFLFVDLPEPHFRDQDTAFGPRARGIANILLEHLISIEKAKEWPGTRLGNYGPNVEPFARIHRYRLNPASSEIISRSARGLYEWHRPELPLDLCLIRRDADPWLVNIALHEEAFLNLTVAEAAAVRAAVPTLTLEREYQH